MDHETESALDNVEQNLETIHSDDATEVAVARAMEQLKHNAEAAFDSYRGSRGWSAEIEDRSSTVGKRSEPKEEDL